MGLTRKSIGPYRGFSATTVDVRLARHTRDSIADSDFVSLTVRRASM